MMIVLVVLAMIGLFALCNNNDNDLHSMGPVLVSHHYDGDDDGYGNGSSGGEYGNGNDQRRRCEEGAQCRGSFSPGPFDRSPIDFSNSCISLDCSGRDRDRGDRRPPEQRMSLFPFPTPGGLQKFVLSTVEAGIGLGRLFANATIDFVSSLMVGIA